MKAYKVFDSEWKCRGFQYKVGETYEMKEKPILCEQGFHACKKVSDCFNYQEFNPKNKVAEVDLIGDIVGADGDKQATNKINIIKEISWGEMLELANSGLGNSGYCNSGDWNSGDRNSGHRNSGDRNSGDRNSGDRNSGLFNSGDRNSGHRNSGDRNSGYCNSGYCNSGDRNSGHRNSGHRNSGDWNSGDRNSGLFNSGDWNSGLFNTDEPFIRMFNRDTAFKRKEINIPQCFYFDLTSWIGHDTATDEEKETYKKEIEVCGGFLKTISYKDAFKRAWENASESEKEEVKELPNFDTDIFFEISGIRI